MATGMSSWVSGYNATRMSSWVSGHNAAGMPSWMATGMSSRVPSKICGMRTVHLFLLSQPTGGFLGVVGDDHVGTGALDAG